MAVIRSGATVDELTIDPTSKAGRVTLYDSAGNELTKRKLTYQAGGRLAAGTGLSKATGGATQYQLMSIYHANTSTKTVRIMKAWVTLVSISAAATLVAELVSLTSAATPTTGNPAITPQVFQIGDAAAEATVLALPTTAGTLSSTATGFGSTILNQTAVTASDTTPISAGLPIFLYQYNPLQPTEQPTMRSANAEGWAIEIFPSASVTVIMSCGIEFTEE